MEKLEYGYVWFNGKTLCERWTDTYNHFTSVIASAKGEDAKEFYKNQRHRFLMSCFSILGDSNI